MQVWELMAKLSKCRADAEVWGGTEGHYNAPIKDIDMDAANEDDAAVYLEFAKSDLIE